MIEMSNHLQNAISALYNVRTRKNSEVQSPHKFIFLLTLLKMYEAHPDRENKFPINIELDKIFNDTWLEIHNSIPESNIIEYPFYHLQSDGFWFLVIKDDYKDLFEFYKESAHHRFTKKRLIETVEYGYLSDDFHICMKDQLTRNVLKKILLDKCSTLNYTEVLNLQRFDIQIQDMVPPNPFVAYLNSLHSRDAVNENAIAESQACNPNFSRIHVRHPLLDTIIKQLCDESGRSVILTGHAGDGKSTIAMAVYKQLKGFDQLATLPMPLKQREDIVLPNGISLAIIKDLSEWVIAERDNLISEIVDNKTRVFLVTNTGALLDTLCGYAERKGLGSRAEWEPKILEAMDAESSDFDLNMVSIVFYNLALQDNLTLARSIFERMISLENWDVCPTQTCRDQCPIYRNVLLFKERSGLPIHRLFLAYRRMFEYGTRLTIRQLTAHLAYMITSGMEYSDIREIAEQMDKPLMSEFLFCNRFFGDNGRSEDHSAARMRVISEVRAQRFGVQPCPNTERHLWLLTHGENFTLGVPLIEEEFGKLRRYGSMGQQQDNGLTPDQAREQVRRMLYFLHDFSDADKGESFLRQYLGSLAILKWERWQYPASRLSMDENSHFKQRVFHVLQEQFTGVHLPEIGGLAQNYLYITLSRRRHEIRQSAQIVLAQIDFSNEFRIILKAFGEKSQRRDLVLMGQGRLDGISLTLTLPFLDYVLARHQGEVGETLQAAYSDRLERLKADLILRCRNIEDDDMLLVRLRTNHTFLRQHFAVVEGRLEVSNA